ncbi:hypothetical protein A3F06_04395 [candidate division TM6 bacterium RIFCSPHIGHO2_12_FULL_36_22]|nr:MAG: hypothetical protein A3F06_04395 [candidate division TM6 bacterium RIFCSPHIGHO2_12_FULL_36_22]
MYLLIILSYSSLRAGVYIVVDLADNTDAKQLINKIQEKIKKQLEELNANSSCTYSLELPAFTPHLSLAFVSQGPLNLENIKQDYPELISQLKTIAKDIDPIIIDAKNIKTTAWDGKFSVEHDGITKKNYLNIVSKLLENKSLSALAFRIAQLLNAEYNIEQKFTFSPHITIGRVFEKQDRSVAEVKNIFDELESTSIPSIQINEFQLKGHDGSAENFKLHDYEKSSNQYKLIISLKPFIWLIIPYMLRIHAIV